MTMTEHEAKIGALIERFNKAMDEEVVDMRKLNAIEAELKAATADAKKDKKTEVYGVLSKNTNPMLEACRMHHFEYPAYAFTKEDGEITGVEASTKTANISPVEFGSRLIKESESKSCPYERTGVCKTGHAWEYRSEKLAYMLTYRTIKKLGGSPADIEEFKHSYAIRDLAAREKMGETPTSNTQLVKVLQSIIDMLVFTANDKGENAVKANGKDVEYLLAMFEKAGRGVGVVEVLKGNKVKDYIFTVCHMIVTGKPYEVKYAKKKEGSSEQPVTVRKPVEGKKSEGSKPASKKDKSKNLKVSESETVQIPRPKKSDAQKSETAEVSSSELPSMDEIPAAEIA